MKYQVIAPSNGSIHGVRESKTLPAFSEPVLTFIATLSNRILNSLAFNQYPELIAMAYWMRKSKIAKLKQAYFANTGEGFAIIRMARGTVFHIAPSNVDTIFMYSLLLSMLVGNCNIVRLSSKKNEQLNLLINAINALLEADVFEAVSSRLLLVQYERDEEVTGYLSGFANMRVIWGGDDTIRAIRKIPIQPNGTELVFPDKNSFCLIRAEAFLALENKKKLLTNFYNDAYWFGQMACSSPKMLVWLGADDNAIQKAKEQFWRLLQEVIVQKTPDISTADIVNKMVAQDSIAIEQNISIDPSKNNYLNRIELKNLQQFSFKHHCGPGLFYEWTIHDLDQLNALISRNIQTISVFGIDMGELKTFIINNQAPGIDRIVQIGHALNFSEVWDGHELLNEFSRCINFEQF